MTSSVDSTLAERGEQYGLFIEGAHIWRSIQSAMETTKSWEALDVDMKYAATMIAMKLARALNGNASNVDNWHDIQGYAKLVEDRLLGRGAYANAKLGDVQSALFRCTPECKGCDKPCETWPNANPRVARRSTGG